MICPGTRRLEGSAAATLRHRRADTRRGHGALRFRHQRWIREMGRHFGTEDTVTRAPTGVFFGEPGKTVGDPYFGGEGPDRTGCTRCGACMVGCRVGAVNSLTRITYGSPRSTARRSCPNTRSSTSPRSAPPTAATAIASRQSTPAPGSARSGTPTPQRGVVFAAGALGTNELLANCKHGGSLPRISDRLGELVRTNSESVLTVLLPEDRESWRDVTASSSVHVDADTQIELLTYGPHADMLEPALHRSGRRRQPPDAAAQVARGDRCATRGAVAQDAVAGRLEPAHGDAAGHAVAGTTPSRSAPEASVRPRLPARHRQEQRQSQPDLHRQGPTRRPAGWPSTPAGSPKAACWKHWPTFPSTAHILGGAVIGADPPAA